MELGNSTNTKPKTSPSLPANYVTIAELRERWNRERHRKEKEKDSQNRSLREEEEEEKELREARDSAMEVEKKLREEKSVKVKASPSLPANYVTIIQLQERWLKEKEKEKEKERGSEKELRLEPGSGPRDRPRNDRNVGSRSGLGQNGGGGARWSEKPKPRVGGEVAVEGGGSVRVGPKTEEIDGKLGDLSGKIKGVGRETSGRTYAVVNGSSDKNVALQYVPKAETVPVIEGGGGSNWANRAVQSVPEVGVFPVNEGNSRRTKPWRSNGCGKERNRDTFLVWEQRSGNDSDNTRGNRMDRNVGFDGKLEEVPMGDASGRSKKSRGKGNGMDRNVNVDGKMEKSLGSVARGETRNGGNGMDETLGIDGELEKVPMGDARGRCGNGGNKNSEMDRNVNVGGKFQKVRSGARGESSNAIDGAVGIDEKMEKVPMRGAKGKNNYKSSKCNEINMNVNAGGKLEKALKTGARGESSNVTDRMEVEVGIEGEMEKVSMSHARGRSNSSSSKSFGIDRTVNADGKLEKALRNVARDEHSNVNDGMDGAVGIDGEMEKVPIGHAKERSNNNSRKSYGINRNVKADGKSKKTLKSGARGESTNVSDRMEGEVGIDEKMEKVGYARGRSNNNSSKSYGMYRIVNVGGKLEKALRSAARDESSNVSDGMDDAVGIDEKMEKVPMGHAGGRSNNYSSKSYGIDRDVNADGKLEKALSGARGKSSNVSDEIDGSSGIDGKMEKVPMDHARGRSNNNRNKKYGRDRNVNADGKLKKTLWSGERVEGCNGIDGMNGAVSINGKMEKGPMSGVRGEGSISSNGGNMMDMTKGIDGKLEKVPMSGVRTGSSTCSNGSSLMNKTVGIDGKLEKVLMSGAKGANSIGSKESSGMDGTGIDEKLEKMSMSGGSRGSNTCSNGSNMVDETVGVDGKLEKVLMNSYKVGSNSKMGYRVNRKREIRRTKMERNYFRPGAVMAWVKKGEFSDGNAVGIQNSCGSSKGSE